MNPPVQAVMNRTFQYSCAAGVALCIMAPCLSGASWRRTRQNATGTNRRGERPHSRRHSQAAGRRASRRCFRFQGSAARSVSGISRTSGRSLDRRRYGAGNRADGKCGDGECDEPTAQRVRETDFLQASLPRAADGERTLFTPVQIGEISLKHRVVMAPLTRSRAVQPGDVPGALMKEYYGQRASDGGLIISEATTIALNAKGWYGAPGMYTDEQVEGWRSVVDVVHAKGGKMFSQLWHTGRASHVETTGGLTPVSASAGTFEGGIVSTPTGWKPPSPARALEISEIPQIVEDYRRAAERAKA